MTLTDTQSHMLTVPHNQNKLAESRIVLVRQLIYWFHLTELYVDPYVAQSTKFVRDM